MEKITIPASELPEISGLIKDVINLGLWFLYEIDYKPNPQAKYSLSTDKDEYLLSESGSILSPVPKDGDVEYKSSVTFSGIPTAPVANMPTI